MNKFFRAVVVIALVSPLLIASAWGPYGGLVQIPAPSATNNYLTSTNGQTWGQGQLPTAAPVATPHIEVPSWVDHINGDCLAGAVCTMTTGYGQSFSVNYGQNNIPLCSTQLVSAFPTTFPGLILQIIPTDAGTGGGPPWTRLDYSVVNGTNATITTGTAVTFFSECVNTR